MARVAIVNVSNGIVVGDNEDDILALDDDDLFAEMGEACRVQRPREARTFALWRLPTWEGMTEAEYLPRSVPALEAAGAALVRT